MHPSLEERVVEVCADRGEGADRFSYGSGFWVAGRTVVTAAHVVTGANKVWVRTVKKREFPASLEPEFAGFGGERPTDGSKPPDLALLTLRGAEEAPPWPLGRLERGHEAGLLDRVRAIGYPWFADEGLSQVIRSRIDAHGLIPLQSHAESGLFAVQVTIAPPTRGGEFGQSSQWGGMSGAPILAHGRFVGVVCEHASRQGDSTITGVPLTALERESSRPLWGVGVPNPEAWWALLGVDGIDKLEPLPKLREAPYQATLRELGNSLHRRMPQLEGRANDLAEIVAFATGCEEYRWIIGGAFTGKSALLYEAVTAGLPSSVDVVSYFLSRRTSVADSSNFLIAVVPQLAILVGEEVGSVESNRFNQLWQAAAAGARVEGRHLLLVVDGLDEDLHPSGVAPMTALLPTLVGDHAHVLVSSRPYQEVQDILPATHPLANCTPFPLSGFPGWEELRDLGLDEVDALAHAGGLSRDILGILTAAAGALSVSDLTALHALCGSPLGDEWDIEVLLTEQAPRSFDRVGSRAQPRYQFAHASLLEMARSHKGLKGSSYRDRIHKWADQWRKAGWPTFLDGSEDCTPRYLLDAYPATLRGDALRLATLTGDVLWVRAAIQSIGLDAALAQLRIAASILPEHQRIAAMLATVQGAAHYLRGREVLDYPHFVDVQLCIQAAELDEEWLSAILQSHLVGSTDPGPIFVWTNRRVNRSLESIIGDDYHVARGMAALPDGRVVSVGFGPAALLADGSERKSPGALLWNLATPQSPPVEFRGSSDTLWAVAVLSDGRVVSGTSTEPSRVLMWDPTAPQTDPVELGRHSSIVMEAVALPNGLVATSGPDEEGGSLLVWDPDAPQSSPFELSSSPGSWTYWKLAALSDGRLVSGGQRDGRLLIWNSAAPRVAPIELGCHDGGIGALAALPDGRVVSGGRDGRIFLWDPAAPTSGPVQLGCHGDTALALAALPDGRVVSGGNDQRLLMWNPSEPLSNPVQLGERDTSAGFAVLPDGRLLTGDATSILVWNPTVEYPQSAEAGVVATTTEQGFDVATVMVADGRVVSGGDDGRVLIWDPSAPNISPIELARHDGPLSALAALPDGRVISGGADGTVLVSDASAPHCGPIELGRHGDRVRVGALAALSDGRVASGGADGRVLVWDPSGAHMGPIELGRHGARVWALAALPDGRVVSGGDNRVVGSSLDNGRILLWDPAAPTSGPVELGCHGDRVAAMAALPDGRVVSGGDDGRVLVWDSAAPQADPTELGLHSSPLPAALGMPPLTTSVVAVSVLPDGRVVSSGLDRRVRVWDLPSRGCRHMVACAATGLATTLSRSGQELLAISHRDGGLSLWAMQSGTPEHDAA